MIKKIIDKLFPPKEKKSPITYKIGGGLGDAINWWSTNKLSQDNPIGRVVGWKDRRPKIGDLLEARMVSGNIMIFVFIKVEYCDDPPDMFFADVKPLKYKDNND